MKVVHLPLQLCDLSLHIRGIRPRLARNRVINEGESTRKTSRAPIRNRSLSVSRVSSIISACLSLRTSARDAHLSSIAFQRCSKMSDEALYWSRSSMTSSSRLFAFDSPLRRSKCSASSYLRVSHGEDGRLRIRELGDFRRTSRSAPVLCNKWGTRAWRTSAFCPSAPFRSRRQP